MKSWVIRISPNSASPPEKSVASLNTHDMPPFRAFLDGTDIDDRLDLGFWMRKTAQAERETGSNRAESLRCGVKNLPCRSDGRDPEFLSDSMANIVLVNVEDLWEETLPQNVPATITERPNWRRRLRPSIEQIRKMAGVARCSPMSLLSDHDLYLFNEGSHVQLYDRLGSHPAQSSTESKARISPSGRLMPKPFLSWARSTAGTTASHPLQPRGSSGIWEGFVPNVRPGDAYKYHVVSRYHGYRGRQGRPFRVSRGDAAAHRLDRLESRLRMARSGSGWRHAAAATR